MNASAKQPTPIPHDAEQESFQMFPQYQPGDRHSVEPIKHTRQAGWLTVALGVLLVWALGKQTPPAHVTLTGLAMGAVCMLRGALMLPAWAGRHRTALAERMTHSLERWFPHLLFAAQTLYLFLLVSLLWFTLPLLGVRLHPALHIGMYTLLTLITVRRLIAEWARHKSANVRLPVQDGLQYATTIIVTILLAVALTHAVSPFGHPITGDNTIPIVVIWVIATFVVLCCVVMFIDRFSKRHRT